MQKELRGKLPFRLFSFFPGDMVLKRTENASQEKQGQPPTSPLRKNRVPGPGGVMLRALVPGAKDIFDVHGHQGLGKTFGTQASTSSGFTMPRGAGFGAWC